MAIRYSYLLASSSLMLLALAVNGARRVPHGGAVESRSRRLLNTPNQEMEMHITYSTSGDPGFDMGWQHGSVNCKWAHDALHG